MSRRILGALCVLVTLGLPLHAQTPSGEISGTVVDSSGSVLPGVRVTLTNSGTVTGGNGGAGGIGQPFVTPSDGSPGAGGAGIVGSQLTVINSGAVNGPRNLPTFGLPKFPTLAGW